MVWHAWLFGHATHPLEVAKRLLVCVVGDGWDRQSGAVVDGECSVEDFKCGASSLGIASEIMYLGVHAHDLEFACLGDHLWDGCAGVEMVLYPLEFIDGRTRPRRGPVAGLVEP